jgi:hypothetical protein
MASDLVAIWAELLAAVTGVTSLKYVTDTPLSEEAFVAGVLATADNIPAAHLAIRKGGEPSGYTCGDLLEKLPVRVTVVYQHEEATMPLVFALRDAIIDAMEADISLGGHADLLVYAGWGISKQEGYTTVFFIDYEVVHQWAV